MVTRMVLVWSGSCQPHQYRHSHWSPHRRRCQEGRTIPWRRFPHCTRSSSCSRRSSGGRCLQGRSSAAQGYTLLVHPSVKQHFLWDIICIRGSTLTYWVPTTNSVTNNSLIITQKSEIYTSIITKLLVY